MPGVVVRQRKPFRRKDGLFIYFEGAFRRFTFLVDSTERITFASSSTKATDFRRVVFICADNAGVIVNPKGEMKGALFSCPDESQLSKFSHGWRKCSAWSQGIVMVDVSAHFSASFSGPWQQPRPAAAMRGCYRCRPRLPEQCWRRAQRIGMVSVDSISLRFAFAQGAPSPARWPRRLLTSGRVSLRAPTPSSKRCRRKPWLQKLGVFRCSCSFLGWVCTEGTTAAQGSVLALSVIIGVELSRRLAPFVLVRSSAMNGSICVALRQTIRD